MKKYLCCAVALAAALAANGRVWAVEGGEKSQKLEEVVVSASRMEQSSLEAPASVSVVTTDDLAKSNVQRLGDALNAKVPGVYLRGAALGNSRPGVTATLTMRGQGGNMNKVAVLVDGMNMVDAYSGAINWSMISMEDVERIEVVPGAGSSLYGSNAVGGVISIITKAPTKQEMSFNLGKGFGDASGKSASVMYRNRFANGIGVVFGASQNDRDGYIAEYVTKMPSDTPVAGAVVVDGATQTSTVLGATTYIVGDKGKNGSTSKNIHGKLYFDLSPTSKINAGFAYTNNKSLGSAFHSYLTDASTGEPVPVTTTATNLSLNGLKTSIKESDFYGSLPMGNTALRYFAGYEGELPGKSKLGISIGKIKRDNWSASAGKTATLTSGAGTFNSSPNSTSNALAQLTMPVGSRQVVIAGLASESGILHIKKYATTNWTDRDSKTDVLDWVDAKSTTNSVFLQDQLATSEKLTLYIGGRYDQWKASGSGAVITGTYPGTFNYPERTSSAFSPKLAGVYQLSDRFSVKSSIGTAFRAPTNYYLFTNPSFSGAAAPNGKLIRSNQNLKPEKATAFDLGTEYHFARGGNVKATGFITKTKDLIYEKTTKVATYTDPVINKVIDYESIYENTGSALARGIELAGEYPLTGWLSISGSYAYTDARITRDKTDTGMNGKRVTNVPKDLASLALEARHGGLSGVFSARYVGEQFSRSDNADTVKGVWTGYSKYTVADVKVGCEVTRNMKVNLMVDNLFDKEYYEYYRMPGRSVMVEVAGTF